MAQPSLQALLDRADELIKSSSANPTEKTASSDVAKFAEMLVGATEPVEITGARRWTEIEKTAMALNMLEAATEIDMIKRLEKFASKAKEEGYTEDQICEAITKVSASKVAGSIGTLVALGVGEFGGKDKNSELMKKRKLPQGIGHQLITNISKSLGY